jgi:leader peptidase (prepilin peptidase)/N-methyltransferase
MVMDRVLGRDSLGGGDIKLFALTGLYLGLIGTLFALLLSAVLGLVFALLLKKRRSQAFPFGPAIAAADALMLLFGDGLVSWYLGLLG